MTIRRTCEFCRGLTPVNYANGITVVYKSEGKRDVCVLLHKSCAAAWSKRFTHTVSMQIQPLAHVVCAALFLISFSTGDSAEKASYHLQAQSSCKKISVVTPLMIS
jgi:hypothetical protein